MAATVVMIGALLLVVVLPLSLAIISILGNADQIATLASRLLFF